MKRMVWLALVVIVLFSVRDGFADIPDNLALISALEDLRNASFAKIDNDAYLIATKFSSTKNIDISLRWASLFGSILRAYP